MNRTIEPALLSLLPTQNAVLPPQLVDLASSLLAQSRHRVSTLKAEEEIARPYACAHIACDRLKISLNLPPIDPRPPIPPRIYKRLYNHLDSILPSSSLNASRTGRIRTPSSKILESRSSPLSRPTPSRPTPTKAGSLAQYRSPAAAKSNTPSKPQTKHDYDHQNKRQHSLPPWVQPTVRLLCRELNHAQLAPTVMAGMHAIAIPQGHRTDDEWVYDNLTALLGSIYFYVAKQADGITEYDREQYKAAETAVLEVLTKARASAINKDAADRETWEGWADIRSKQLQKALVMVSDRRWLENDWFRDLEIRAEDDRQRSNDRRDSQGLQDGAMQVQRADTMLQDRYDYLTETKRNDYKLWKESIMKRIEEVENVQPEQMEIDT